MSTLAALISMTNATTAEASDVNTNFTDVRTYINSNCLVKDGALALTGVLDCSTAPTSGNHLANKTYVDGLVGRNSGLTSGGPTSFGSSNTWTTFASATITNPGKAVVVELFGNLFITANTSGTVAPFFQVRLALAADGTTTYTTFSIQNRFTPALSGTFTASPVARYAGTPTGDIKIALQGYQATGGSTFGTASEFSLMYDMFKTVAI